MTARDEHEHEQGASTSTSTIHEHEGDRMDLSLPSPARAPARARASSPDRILPRTGQYRVELREPAARSAGGIYLPDNWVANWTDGVVRAAGGDRPGQPLMWASVGDVVLFEKHHWRPLEGRQGMVAEADLIGLFPAGDEAVFWPANDWVMLAQDPEPPAGAIALPEAYRPKAMSGRICNWGPGRRIARGPGVGCRRPVPAVLGLRDAVRLKGRRAFWPPDCELLACGRETLEFVLVRAEDLYALEAEGAASEGEESR
jgi:co-chaperonin GroES (HSP10)